jgi:antirestriction protein ArdC
MPDIRQFDNAEEYYSVLAHEHIHWSGSDTRLKRNKLNYAEEELVAEIGAFLTSIHLGIQSSPKPNNLAYLKSWSKGEINKMKIFSALSDAHKSVNFLKDNQVSKAKKVA